VKRITEEQLRWGAIHGDQEITATLNGDAEMTKSRSGFPERVF
jgi:hypothetical protein